MTNPAESTDALIAEVLRHCDGIEIHISEDSAVVDLWTSTKSAEAFGDWSASTVRGVEGDTFSEALSSAIDALVASEKAAS